MADKEEIRIPRELLDDIFKEKHPRKRSSLIDFKKLNDERRKNGLPAIGRDEDLTWKQQ